jgi:VWFA-related protein
MRGFAVLFFIFAIVVLAAAQNDPSGRPPVLKGDQNPATNKTSQSKSTKDDDEVIKVDTDLVTTPVSVLDRQGRFIGGLRKKDFKIFENDVAQPITYFQSEEQPFTVVLMMDTSPSTRYKIDDIHWAAIQFLNQLRPNDKVMVVSFDQRVRLWTPEPTSDRKELYTAIYKTNFGSGTSLYEAVAAVAQLNQMKSTGRKAMVLFTDGVDTTSRMASYQSTIDTAEEIDALIYPIRYDTMDHNGGGGAPAAIDLSKLLRDTGGNAPQGMIVQTGRGQTKTEYDRGAKYLQTLADNSGGRLFEADTTTNLDAAFAGIAEELRRQYSIGYYPDKSGEPGERRSIRIEVLLHPNVVVRAKRYYVVQRNRTGVPSSN